VTRGASGRGGNLRVILRRVPATSLAHRRGSQGPPAPRRLAPSAPHEPRAPRAPPAPALGAHSSRAAPLPHRARLPWRRRPRLEVTDTTIGVDVAGRGYVAGLAAHPAGLAGGSGLSG